MNFSCFSCFNCCKTNSDDQTNSVRVELPRRAVHTRQPTPHPNHCNKFIDEVNNCSNSISTNSGSSALTKVEIEMSDHMEIQLQSPPRSIVISNSSTSDISANFSMIFVNTSV